MSDYTKTTNFSAKDSLSSGNANKLVKGSEHDTEYDNIATAIATKYDSSDIASSGDATAETSNTVLMTPLRVANWADANAGIVGDLQSLTDPGADRLLFWDDGAGAAAFLTVSTGLSLSGTSLTTDDSAIVHDNLSGFVANEHIDHSSVSILAGVGLSGGGTIAASRTLTVDLNELTTETSIAAGDFIAMVDITDSGSGKITFANFEGALNHDSLTGFVSNEHINHANVEIQAGDGLSGGGTIAATRSLAVDSTVARTDSDETFTGRVTVNDDVVFNGVRTESGTGQQDDVSTTDAFMIRFTGDATRLVTGFAGGVDGKVICIINDAASNGSLLNLNWNNTASVAANRIEGTSDIGGFALEQHEALLLIYDGAASRWRPLHRHS